MTLNELREKLSTEPYGQGHVYVEIEEDCYAAVTSVEERVVQTSEDGDEQIILVVKHLKTINKE